MNNVEIILGPPGTGKTTTLLNQIDSYLQDGHSAKAIGFISFTKKSVDEAKTRAAKRFKKDPEWFSYFRTIHSLAFRQLGMSTSNVLDRKNYRELGDELGLKITCTTNMDTPVYEMSKGDRLVFIESLSRLCCESLEDTYHRMSPDLSIAELDLYARSLRKYKDANMLVDFTDMLTKYVNEGYKPELEVLFIDEAQDLCPLQWKIVQQLSKYSKKVIVAGDDDQAIFRWSGADVEYFISLTKSHPTIVLQQSYRLPKSVYDLSKKISGQLSNCVDKEYLPTKEEGLVEYCNSLDDIDMGKGTWLVLVRNIFLGKDIVEYVRSLGFSYEGFGDIPKNEPSLLAAFTWEKLRKGMSVKIDGAKVMLSYMSRKKLRGNVKTALMGRGDNEEVDLKALTKWCGIFDPDEIWHKALDKISVEDREYYIAARRRGESLVKGSRIKISTIHGAKGGEAENVVLFTDMSIRTYNGMSENYDDEVRVFYVGITRTLKNLYIIQPKTPYHFTL